MIPVTKPFLPSREKLDKYIDGIYERQWLTNNGVLVQELTQRLEEYLGVKNLLVVSNGTLALQIAYRALGVSDTDRRQAPEAITTPFSFIATASSLKWEGVQPVFADIDPDTWCLDPANIEAAITANTRAIVPVHVFGNACDVEAIDSIAAQHDLKVVYDASHAFGVNYKGESLLNYGDAATLSFHATKLFHTIEGGAIVFKHEEDLERAKKLINFGITGPESIDEVGINAKMNEFQAAMGLCLLDEIEGNLKIRSEIVSCYNKYLPYELKRQKKHICTTNNYSYMPVVFGSEIKMLETAKVLRESGIFVRRYFYPSLSDVLFFESRKEMPVSEDLAKRIVCLPIYVGLENKKVMEISSLVSSSLI